MIKVRGKYLHKKTYNSGWFNTNPQELTQNKNFETYTDTDNDELLNVEIELTELTIECPYCKQWFTVSDIQVFKYNMFCVVCKAGLNDQFVYTTNAYTYNKVCIK